MIDYKFNEKDLIKEFQTYVDTTYDGHYSKDKFQATEFIIDGGHGTGFCIGNVLKYAQRYGKKGRNKDSSKDLMKVLHYALIQLFVHDRENEMDTDLKVMKPNRTSTSFNMTLEKPVEYFETSLAGDASYFGDVEPLTVKFEEDNQGPGVDQPEFDFSTHSKIAVM